MRHIYRFLQLTLIVLASVVVYNGHMLGLALLPFLAIECVFKNGVKNQVTMLVVLLFIIQVFGIMAFYFGTSSIDESGHNSLHRMIKVSDGLIRSSIQGRMQPAPKDSIAVTKKEKVASLRKLDSVHYDRVAAYVSECTNFSDSSYDVHHDHDLPQIKPGAMAYLTQSIGDIPASDFPDLKRWSSDEVRARLSRVFAELPADGFLSEYRNPCWMGDVQSIEEVNKRNIDRKKRQKRQKGKPVEEEEERAHPALSCLPYAYILGQPKSGTTDLFQRLSGHPSVYAPRKKEVCRSSHKFLVNGGNAKCYMLFCLFVCFCRSGG
jgi:hypothetical protein